MRIPTFAMESPRRSSTAPRAAVLAALGSFLGSPASCEAIGALRPAHFSAQLLRPDDSTPSSSSSFCGLKGGSSYMEQIADTLIEWHHIRLDPVTRRRQLEEEGAIPSVPANVVTSGVITIDNSSSEHIQRVPIERIDLFVASVVDYYYQDDAEALNSATRALLDAIGGARGLLTLLGHAQTAGSVAIAPLTRSQCIEAFQRRRSPREPLSVGARALAKHCQRVVTTGAGAVSAWGASEMRGNDASKNARALEVLERLLNSAVWKNVHALPPFTEDKTVVTMEIRDTKGYGARWEIRSTDASSARASLESDDRSYMFRGFLEPPMADGHEKGWKH